MVTREKTRGNRKLPRGRPFEKGNKASKGRPKTNHDVQALAKQYTTEAVERLAHWMRDDNSKASVAACMALLDRGWGKAPQSHTGEGGEGPIKHQHAVTWLTEAEAQQLGWA